VVLGLENSAKQFPLKIYPNPSNDYFELKINALHMNFDVYAIDGKWIGTFDAHERVDIHNWEDGLYIIHVDALQLDAKFLKN
jgi:hypothetical protein